MATYPIQAAYSTPTYDLSGRSRTFGFSVNGQHHMSYADALAASERFAYEADLGQTLTSSEFLVDPFTTDAQERMSDLIESRYDFLKEKSDPLESALFKYSSYDNPELYNSYVSEAIPNVQQGLQQERGLMDRTLAATGSSFSDQESVLRDKLTSLQSQESITQAANQIRTRLKDREQQIAFGSAPAATNMQGGI